MSLCTLFCRAYYKRFPPFRFVSDDPKRRRTKSWYIQERKMFSFRWKTINDHPFSISNLNLELHRYTSIMICRGHNRYKALDKLRVRA